jgi:Prokaryotic E2 family E
MVELSPRTKSDFARLKERHPDATLTPLPSGSALVEMPFEVPPGWPVSKVTLRFLVPNGYSTACPDCFWVEPNLTIGSGTPRNSELNKPIPETAISAHWFSWHIDPGKWSPNDSDLLVWLSVCTKRLQCSE